VSVRDEEHRTAVRAENKAFWVRFSLAMLIGLAAINVFVLLFVVPKFKMIFADALPGKPLPPVTNFILDYPFALIVVAIA
jgi:type II secretory pathway component PulF